MKPLPGFDIALSKFIQEECRQEADTILKEKDVDKSTFNLMELADFSFDSLLE